MTVTSTTARTGPYDGDGSTVAFDYTFLILDDDDIVVTLTSAAGVDTTLTKTTHYTVSGVGNVLGGTVTMVTAPASGEQLTMTRSTAATQELDLVNLKAVNPEAIETALDRLTLIAQDASEKLGRAVLASPTEEAPVTYADLVSAEAGASAAATAAQAARVAAEAAQVAAEAAENSLLEWKGAWVTATAYAPSDIVYQSGSAYVCLVAHTSGTFSTDLSAGRWQLFAAQGAPGAGTGDMLAANNLSDLVDADTALANLGGGATGIAIFKDTTPAAVRTELGLGTLATLNSVTTSQIAAATLVTAAEGIVSNDNDTTIPTSAAVKAYADSASPDYGAGNAALSAGGVGTYMFATTIADTNTDYNFGDTIAGSGLRPCGAYTNDTGLIQTERLSATVPAGTWRCMGYCENSAASTGENTMTLWLRIS